MIAVVNFMCTTLSTHFIKRMERVLRTRLMPILVISNVCPMKFSLVGNGFATCTDFARSNMQRRNRMHRPLDLESCLDSIEINSDVCHCYNLLVQDSGRQRVEPI